MDIRRCSESGADPGAGVRDRFVLSLQKDEAKDEEGGGR